MNDPANAVTVDVGAVRAALTAARHPLSRGAVTARPLLDLTCVEKRLSEMGLADNADNRRLALIGLLHDLVWDHLASLRLAIGRSARPADGSHDRGAVLADLAADFRAGGRGFESWGALAARYLAPVDVPVGKLAQAAGVGRVTFARRLNDGLALLTETLQLAEVDARALSAPVLRGRAAARTEPLAARPAPVVTQQALAAYHLARVTEWSRLDHALDKRFTNLALLVDRGPHAGERWQAEAASFDDLAAALAAAGSPAAVLLGPPGSGKSTLFRAHEYALATAGLSGRSARVSFYVPLARLRAGSAVLEPRHWLEERWALRFPQLPALATLLARGQVTLLLDGLNEMPHADALAYHRQIGAWREFLLDTVSDPQGNQAIFSCRSLDYSAPLSSPDLVVPQIRILPLSDDQVHQFFVAYGGPTAEAMWPQLAASGLLDGLRVPYALRLLAEQAAMDGSLPDGRAGLFTTLVRQALRRGLERGQVGVEPGEWLSPEDLRQVTRWRWRDAYDLPARGRFVPGLTTLADHMQRQAGASDGGLVSVRPPAATQWLRPRGAALLDLGLSLGLLSADIAGDDLSFAHQLLQEYFAARAQAGNPNPALASAPWRDADITPSVAALLASLSPGEQLPALSTSGWEETFLMAAEMTTEPVDLIEGLMVTNLALAGRAAALATMRPRLSEALLDRLRWSLAERSRDPLADLRARIAAGLALGPLGDPRLQRGQGPDGQYLVPPTVPLAGGVYRVGRDEPFEVLGRLWPARYLAHELELPPLAIGQFLVTNAEWACFMLAGGYEDERWWPTPTAAAWRRGEGTTAGIHDSVRTWTARYRAEPELLEATYRSGSFGDAFYERWRQRIGMSEAQLEQHLVETYPSERRTAPRFWQEPHFNNPAQPVVGITWFEARAYSLWLAAQTGDLWRLPRDVELEAAARGPGGRAYPYGDSFSPLGGNTVTTKLRQTTPVGVFVAGDTPDGLCDMSGNAEAYTSTLAAPLDDAGWVAAPRYVPALEDPAAPDSSARVLRGGSWRDNHTRAHPAYGVSESPDTCPETSGMRLVCDIGIA